jgi:hypothetical protein
MQAYPTPPQNTLNLILVTAAITAAVALLVNNFFPVLGNLLLKPITSIYKAFYKRLARTTL